MHELLEKYFVHTITEEDRRALFQEIDNDQSLKDEFANLQNTFAMSGMMGKTTDKAWSQRKKKELDHIIQRRRIRKVSFYVLKYAAVAVLFFCIWMGAKTYYLQEGAEDFIHIEAPKGQRVYITLADGTEAWLSSRTKLKIPNHFNKKDRTIELDGEGFFSVSKDSQKPFIVKTRQYNVQVTGTRFNVFAYAESLLFETDLMEGAVFVYKQENPEKLYLKPGEKVYSEEGKLLTSYSTFDQSQYVIKNGIYSFEKKSLKELLTRLELWYDVKINVLQPEKLNYVFGGKFRQSDDINNILYAIQETGKFNYRIINEEEIEIY